MPLVQQPERTGIRTTGTRTSIIAAGLAGEQVVYIFSTTNNRTYRARKIMGYNGQAGNVLLTLGVGVGAAWAQQFPTIVLIGGQDFRIPEEELPALMLGANLIARASAAGAAPNDIEVLVEAEEYQS